jgi:vacuolar protein sorting-associated protein 13A/C
LKPISAKAKLIITKSTEATVPKLLLDVVLQDTVVQMSRAQFSSMVALQEAFQRIDKNRQVDFSIYARISKNEELVHREYRELHPGVNLHKNASLWWKYALNAVLAQRVRPYTWSSIKKHRFDSKSYKEILNLIPNVGRSTGST